ncbi:MAG TPA: hypothetical protein VF394_00370, partial [Candidatus Acidoferrum sp.]
HTLINVPIHFLPAKIYYGQKTSQPTVRYFADKFPMFFGSGASCPLPVQSSGPEVSCKLPQLVHIGTQTVVAVEIANAA